MSIYGGGPFADENFKAKHTGPGILSMVNLNCLVCHSDPEEGIMLFFSKTVNFKRVN